MACEKQSAIAPPDELDFDNLYGKYVDTTFSATADTFLVDYQIDSQGGNRLSVGRAYGFDTKFLLRFTDLPETGVYMDSVRLRIYPSGYIVESMGEMHLDIIEMQEDWPESANEEPYWHTFKGGQLLKTIAVSPSDSGMIEVSLDTALVNQWRGGDDQNYGLLFRSPNASFVQEFYASEYGDGTKNPQLIYRTISDTVFVTDSTTIAEDATIFNYDGTNGINLYEFAKRNNQLLIGSGIAARTLLRFDQLAGLPKNIIIESANLEIPVDDRHIETNTSPNPLDNPNQRNDYFLRIVEEANEDLSEYQIDSAFVQQSIYIYSMAQIDSQLTLSSSADREELGKIMIQDYVDGNQGIEWFYIQFAGEANNISLKRLWDKSAKPAKLRLKYFKLDKSRYE